MNSTLLDRISVRSLTVVTVLSLILSAFPAPFFVAEAADTLFTDSFEANPAFSSPAWSNDPHWGTNGADHRTGARQAQAVGSNSGDDVLSTSIDTSGYENIEFSFWYKKLGMDDGDDIVVEWFDGSSWNTVTTISGVDTDSDDSTDWENFSTTLPGDAEDNSSFAIRFTAAMNSAGNDKFFLEDVNVSGDEIEAATPVSPYENGFENDTAGWNDYGGTITQKASGTDSIPSQCGDYHAEITGSVFTRWGGYADEFPVGGFTTEVDVYLDMALADGSDKGFDFSSAVNNTDGDHRRDFIFHLETNASNPGTWLVNASNNAPGDPSGSGDSVEISETGWYTLQAYFHDNGSGELEVTMNVIKRSDDSVVFTKDRHDASDVIGSTVGGNRYGWFTGHRFDFDKLAIDNSQLYLGAPQERVCESGDMEPYQCTSPDVLHLDVSVTDQSTLYSVNTATGVGTAEQTYDEQLLDLAADASGVLYSTSRDGNYTDDLVILETDGSLTVVGSTGLAGNDKTVAMNFAPDGSLYAMGQSKDALYEINKATGLATLLHTFKDLDVNGGDLVVNSDNELVYVDSNGAVYVINLTTYSSTNVGTLTNKQYTSLALKGDTYYAMGRSGDAFVSFTLDPFVSTVIDTGVGPFDYGDGTSCPVEQNFDQVEETVVIKQADLVSLADLIASSTLFAEPKSWFFYNDETDVIDNSLGSFVNGPDTAPVGDGSAEITVTGTERRNLATYQFSGIKLADVTSLKFSTYNPSAGNGGSANRSAYLNFNVDFDGSDNWQKRLAYVPNKNGTVTQDAWQEWDAVNSGNAEWWWSGYAGNGNKWPDGDTDEYRTWDDLISSFPDIGFRTTDSWTGLRVGEPYNDGYTENIDKFVMGVKDGATVTTTTYDFEPTNYCSVTVVSDETNEVEETEGFAKLLSFVHSAWTAAIEDAEWIWGDDPVVDPTVSETQTFSKTFEWSGGIADATLVIATDNFYEVYLNGNLVATSSETGLFKDENKDTIDVSSFVTPGVNNLEIKVTNKGEEDSTPSSNPAGLKYNLTVTSTEEGDSCMYAPVNPSLTITDPDTDYEVLSSSHTFLAEYVDADSDSDPVQWAIRAGTCSAGSNTVAGNVDGFNNDYDWNGADFSATVDMSSWEDGDYCLVVNPTEDAGTNFRETRWFTLENPVLVSCEADVNLLVNGGFETPIVTHDKKWNAFVDGTSGLGWMVDWFADFTDAPQDALLELQAGVFGWLPSEGSQHAELDTDWDGPGGINAKPASVIITQNIPTVADKTYTLSWDFSPRPGLGTNQNQLGVSVDGIELDDSPYMADGTNNNNTEWTNYTYEFTGTGNEVEIAFWDDGSADGQGTLLDNASLVCNPNTGYSDVFCGDGEVNQEWEQCEPGEEGCADYCRFENQCHADLQLMKITLDETNSTSFDGRAYIGAADKIAPNGYWFNMSDFGTDSAVDVVDDVDGLALEYDGTALKLAFEGNNESGQLDYVQGSFEFMGFADIDGDDVSREINGTTYKLEPTNGSGGFPDAFDVVTTSMIDFDMRADTGNDGVTLALTPAEEFGQCENGNGSGNNGNGTYYRIKGYVWEDENADDDIDEGESYLHDWTITITNGTTTATTTTDSNGYFFFDVEAGTWTLSAEGQANWNINYPESEHYDITVPEVSLTQASPSFLTNLLAMFTFSNVAMADTIVEVAGDYNFGIVSAGGGGGSTSGGSSSGGSSDGGSGPTPQVLGEQTSIVPLGAPNAGFGGSADPADKGLMMVFILAATILFGRLLTRHAR